MSKFFNNKRNNKSEWQFNKMETAKVNLDKAIQGGNQLEIDRAIKEAEIAKQEVAASLNEEKEDINMSVKKDAKTNTKVEVKKEETKDQATMVKQEVKKEEIVNEVKANMVADGQATEKEVNKAGDSKEVQDKAQEVANEVNKEIKEEPKQEEPKQESTTKNASDNKKTLVPKIWQRVSDDGKSLINVITFLGEKLDYSVGLKHKYRFPNLSAADGTTRIITAKFPKEDVKAVTESITYKGYTIDLEKYGNSAVCRLKDPDGICMLEYVSLATVIDVLQDELNDEDCETSWGTIDQVIKFKRGLKSRIKEVSDDDAPVSQRGNNKTTEVKEEPAKEVATDNATDKKSEMEQKIADAQAKADAKHDEAVKEVVNN
jgi:hypothetical protein